MKLYIAEKPSLGRAIADALPKPHKKHDGYIEVANGDCVSWCIGHLLEQAEPDDYDARFKKWQFEHLPIVPQQWQLKAKTKTRKQLTILKKLIKQASVLVHAGDPDRATRIRGCVDNLKKLFNSLRYRNSSKLTVDTCLMTFPLTKTPSINYKKLCLLTVFLQQN
jgi:hypothetical protein